MGEEGVYLRLNVLQVIRVGRAFVAAGAACRIITYGRWAAPEIFILCEALSFQGKARYFSIDRDGLSQSMGGGCLGDDPDEQSIDAAEEADTYQCKAQGG